MEKITRKNKAEHKQGLDRCAILDQETSKYFRQTSLLDSICKREFAYGALLCMKSITIFLKIILSKISDIFREVDHIEKSEQKNG